VLIRDSAYGGMRQALPVTVLLSIFAGCGARGVHNAGKAPAASNFQQAIINPLKLISATLLPQSKSRPSATLTLHKKKNRKKRPSPRMKDAQSPDRPTILVPPAQSIAHGPAPTAPA
jgi:hypothetical protein